MQGEMPKLSQRQPLFREPEKKDMQLTAKTVEQVPDFVLETGLVLRWDAETNQYYPLAEKAGRVEDAQFEDVTGRKTPQEPPVPPIITVKSAQEEALSTWAYFWNGIRFLMLPAFLMLAIGIIKVMIALIDVVVEGIYTKLMPALFSALLEAGYYLGIGVACILALIGFAALAKARAQRLREATPQDDYTPAQATPTTGNTTNNIFQWFIVNDANNAQQVVDQFKNIQQ